MKLIVSTFLVYKVKKCLLKSGKVTHLVGTQSPRDGHLLPILRALSAQSLGRFLGNIVSKLLLWYFILLLWYFNDTSCKRKRNLSFFCKALSISCITYYCKSEMRLWYFFREKISFVCKLLPIYEPFVSVLASKSSARSPSGFAIRC